MEVVTVFLPVFAVMILGWLFKSWKVVDASIGEALFQFVRRVAAPALLLLSIASAPWYGIWQWHFVGVLGIPLITLFVIIMYFFKMMTRDGVNASAVSSLSLITSNVVFFGMPIMYGIFGRPAMVPVAFGILVMMAMLAVCVFVMHAFNGKGIGTGIREGLKAFFCETFVIAIIIGGLYSLSDLAIPSGIAKFLYMLEVSFAPLMLFVIGMSFDARVVEKSFKDIWLAMVIKLIAFPLLVLWIVCSYDYSSIWAVTAVVIAALPTADFCEKLAKGGDKKNKFHHMIGSMVTSTRTVSLVTLFVWFVILAQIFPAEFGKNLAFF